MMEEWKRIVAGCRLHVGGWRLKVRGKIFDHGSSFLALILERSDPQTSNNFTACASRFTAEIRTEEQGTR